MAMTISILLCVWPIPSLDSVVNEIFWETLCLSQAVGCVFPCHYSPNERVEQLSHSICMVGTVSTIETVRQHK